MPLNWGMLALIVGASLAVSAILFAKNKGTRKALGWIGAILIIPGIVTLAFPGTLTFLEGSVSLGGGQLTVTTPTTTVTTVAGVCPPGSVEDVTVTFSGVDAVTGSATGGSHAYKKWVDGVWGPIKSVADAGTDTFSAGDKIQVLFGNATVISNNYHGSLKELALPCGAGTFTASDKMYANGSRTINVFNEEGQPLGASAAETLASGDVATVDIEIKSAFQKGEPYGGIIIAEYNSSNYDDVIINLGGVKLDKPDFYSLVGTANTTRAYSVGPFFGVDKLTGTVTIDVKSTADPTASVGNISLIFYSNDYYIDEDAGSNFAGPDVEDEDATRTRGDLAYFNIHVA